jgi:hypothetical protein
MMEANLVAHGSRDARGIRLKIFTIDFGGRERLGDLTVEVGCVTVEFAGTGKGTGIAGAGN